MRDIRKKTSIVVAVLFISLTLIPITTADTAIQQEQIIPIELTTVQENGFLQTETFYLSDVEWSSVVGKLTTLMQILNMVKGEEAISNALLDFINGNDNPLLSRIISGLLNSQMDFDRQLVISAGWGINLIPFRNSQTDFIKPITFWHYAEQSDTMTFPSMTASLDFSPFKLKSVIGSQLGIMFRFRGVYIHIPQTFPNQSFTFFIGTAKRIINIELPNLELPSNMMI
jgi:hypothetical protein